MSQEIRWWIIVVTVAFSMASSWVDAHDIAALQGRVTALELRR